MKTLAGVLLIVMCLINGIAGMGYLLGGALFNIGGQVADDIAKEEGKESKDKQAAAAMASSSSEKEADEKLAKKEADTSKDLKEAGKDAKNLGAGLTAFGAFLGILAIAQIVLAVMFFTKSEKARIAGIVIGAAAIVAEVISILITSFGVTNAFGMVVGALAITAALLKTPAAQAAVPAGAGYPPPGYPPPPGPPYGS
jgi:hypothetical protein